MATEKKPLGLPSVHQARLDREQGRYSRGSATVWLGIVAAIIGIVVVYRFVEARQLGASKESLLAKERAVKSTVGAAWFPLRDSIETWVRDAARQTEVPDLVDPSVASWDFRSSPGLYLRLRLDDAKEVAQIRKAAAFSMRDGFVGCFLREPNVAAAKGEPDAGAFAEQPWNWQKAYAATRILTDDWTSEVSASEDPLRLQVFEEQYEKAMKVEVPAAIDLVKRSRFFLFVLDEDSPDAKPSEGGSVTLADLERVPHFSRVYLVNLETRTMVLRLRRSAEASFVFAGESKVSDPETLDAMKRQVNNCALAKIVDRTIKDGVPSPTASH
jgi:hypothetical protein